MTRPAGRSPRPSGFPYPAAACTSRSPCGIACSHFRIASTSGVGLFLDGSRPPSATVPELGDDAFGDLPQAVEAGPADRHIRRALGDVPLDQRGGFVRRLHGADERGFDALALRLRNGALRGCPEESGFNRVA